MTNGNYIILSKVLGKLAYLYDSATASVATLKTAVTALMEQIPDAGALGAYPRVIIIAAYLQSIDQSIGQGPAAIQQRALDVASAFLRSPEVRGVGGVGGFFVSPNPVLTDFSTVAQIVTTLQSQMVTDNKTFTDVSATGMVHFLNQFTPTGSWTTASPGTYTDTLYVASAQVTD